MRLIDADALTDWLLNELRKIPGKFDKMNGRQAANMIGKTIDDAPTIQNETEKVEIESRNFGRAIR